MFYIRFRDLNDFSSFPDFLFLYFFTLYNRPAPHQILVDGSDLFFFLLSRAPRAIRSEGCGGPLTEQLK